MVLASINAIFALVFGSIAWQSIPRGWMFVKLGWRAMDSTSNISDAVLEVEKRRDLEHANRFLLAGIGWLVGGIVAEAVGVPVRAGVQSA